MFSFKENMIKFKRMLDYEKTVLVVDDTVKSLEKFALFKAGYNIIEMPIKG